MTSLQLVTKRDKSGQNVFEKLIPIISMNKINLLCFTLYIRRYAYNSEHIPKQIIELFVFKIYDLAILDGTIFDAYRRK